MRAWIKLTSFKEGMAIVVDVADVERVYDYEIITGYAPAAKTPATSVKVSGDCFTVRETVEDVLRLMTEAERRVERDLCFIAEEAAVRARREA